MKPESNIPVVLFNIYDRIEIARVLIEGLINREILSFLPQIAVQALDVSFNESLLNIRVISPFLIRFCRSLVIFSIRNDGDPFLLPKLISEILNRFILGQENFR